jgi:hypothetical protein
MNTLYLANYDFLIGQVVMPNNVYNGQKRIKLVNINTPDKTSKTISTVPVTTPVKYNPIIMAERINLIMLSVDDMFFFILFDFDVDTKMK